MKYSSISPIVLEVKASSRTEQHADDLALHVHPGQGER